MEYNNYNAASIAPLWAVGVPDKPLEWFYPNVFVRGELNGVQGIPGDGKTWLMCELAAQTSVGGIVQGVLDENDVAELPQGKVLYLSGDDAPVKRASRFKRGKPFRNRVRAGGQSAANRFARNCEPVRANSPYAVHNRHASAFHKRRKRE
jgi:hypothetical protein